MRELDPLVDHGHNHPRVAANELPSTRHADSCGSPSGPETPGRRLELRYGWRARRGCNARRRREVRDVLEPNPTRHSLGEAHCDLDGFVLPRRSDSRRRAGRDSPACRALGVDGNVGIEPFEAAYIVKRLLGHVQARRIDGEEARIPFLGFLRAVRGRDPVDQVALLEPPLRRLADHSARIASYPREARRLVHPRSGRAEFVAQRRQGEVEIREELLLRALRRVVAPTYPRAGSGRARRALPADVERLLRAFLAALCLAIVYLRLQLTGHVIAARKRDASRSMRRSGLASQSLPRDADAPQTPPQAAW